MREIKKPRVQSAARAIEILQIIAKGGPEGLKAKDVCEKLRLPRQVVYHLIHTLVSVNVLRKTNAGKYSLGFGVANIAEGFRQQFANAEPLRALVREITAATAETSYAAGWVDGEIVVLATAEGNMAVRAAEIPLGFAGDAHARASGKILLAMASEQDLHQYLKSHALTARTATTLTNREALLREFQRIRKTGYAIDKEEFAQGLFCMAVSIGGMPSLFAISISAPARRFLENRDHYLSVLRRVASTTSSPEFYHH